LLTNKDGSTLFLVNVYITMQDVHKQKHVACKLCKMCQKNVRFFKKFSYKCCTYFKLCTHLSYFYYYYYLIDERHSLKF